MTRNRKVEHLRGTALLAGCSRQELTAIERAADLVMVDAGVVLASPGDIPNPVLLVTRGEAQALGTDGVSTLGGRMHGVAEVLARAPRREHVIASTDAEVLVLEPRRLVPLLQQCPTLTLAVLRQLARTVVENADAVSRDELLRAPPARPRQDW